MRGQRNPDEEGSPGMVTRITVDGDDDLLTREEVAALFLVDPKTVTRWNQQGRIKCVRTPGGHRRDRRGFAAPRRGGREGDPPRGQVAPGGGRRRDGLGGGRGRTRSGAAC